MWNKNLAKPNTSATSTGSISSQLDAAIKQSFGDVNALRRNLTQAAMDRRALCSRQLCFVNLMRL